MESLEPWLLEAPPAGAFSDVEVAGLPDAVQRYLTAAIAPGSPLGISARLWMRGHIKVGRWLPFRARELLNPRRGFVWRARVAGVLTGSDSYGRGRGGMDWRLLGLKTVVHSDGDDVSRSAAERAGAEAVWLPTALLPRFGVRWSVRDDKHIRAEYETDEHPLALDLEVDSDGRIRSFVFDRWGDPADTGDWRTHPCGGELTDYRSWGGLLIPSAGRLGWFYGTDRWSDGEFFRFRITRLDPLNAP